jgi:CRP/FNR family cyclic AMP-dependent transcriptional regulator
MATRPQIAAQSAAGTRRQLVTMLAVEAAAAGPPPNLLAQLSDPARQAVLAMGRRRDYAPADLLYRQGDHHNGVYLIEEGLIRSYYHSEDGRELTLGYWAVGHFVGAPQMFGGGRHTWTSVAVVDARCLWLPGAELRVLAQQWPELALALVDALAHKSQCYCALLQLLATQSMRVRLARLLVMFAARDESMPTKLSHGDMASMIGSTRQWVSQTLARFAEDGLIVKAVDGAIQVVQAQQLARLR